MAKNDQRRQGSRNTRQQRAIRGALAAAGRPLGPEEILSAAAHAVPTLSMATVYRVIRRMVSADELAAVDLPGEPARYELRSAADAHHHHFRCDGCERVFDVTGCPGGLRDLLPRGFTLDRHEIVLYGRCHDCARKAG